MKDRSVGPDIYNVWRVAFYCDTLSIRPQTFHHNSISERYPLLLRQDCYKRWVSHLYWAIFYLVHMIHMIRVQTGSGHGYTNGSAFSRHFIQVNGRDVTVFEGAVFSSSGHIADNAEEYQACLRLCGAYPTINEVSALVVQFMCNLCLRRRGFKPGTLTVDFRKIV